MVMVNYKGPNPLIINGYKFAPGKALEVKDEDFWKMMNAKTFSFRVEKKIIIVPEDFPLEKPKPVKTESEVVKEKEEQAKSRDLPSLKATLRSIEDSDDAEFLINLALVDPREKVKESIERRLEKLKSLENEKLPVE